MGLPYQPSRTAATMASQARVTREAAMRTREVAMRSAATSAMVEQVAGHGGAGGHASAPVMVQNLTNLCLSSSGKGGKEDREGDAVQLRLEGETRVHADAESAPSTSSSDGPVLCWEKAHGAKWQYFGGRDAQAGRKWIDVVDMQPQHNILADAVAFVRSYVVPEGYPESVAPAYTPYMQWRAIQHFFGGAMSVFTTRSLLHALGVSRAGSASSAVAVNWVIKDGAGRIGKMLFARHGKKFDCDLKQLRFAGDLLMELGAGVELATMAFPALFLPLACAANVAKNVAAVTSTSTRAPIYKAFAQRENIGDVTAKGECISNIADLLGAGLGIFLSKQNPPLAATFMALSCGYLMGSYKEVKAVMLPTLNRARFGVAVHSFLDSGKVPSLLEANDKEYIVKGPWAQEKPLELGARIYNAFSSRHEFSSFQSLFEKEQYMINYHPVKRRAYVILKDTATSDDVLRAAFHGHVLLHMLRQTRLQDSKKNPSLGLASTKALSMPSKQLMRESTDVKALIVDSFRSVGELYENFKIDAKAQGWVMGDSLLNPGDARMCVKAS